MTLSIALRLCAAAALATCATGPAAAQDPAASQDLAAIRSAATALLAEEASHLAEEIEVRLDALDRRLRLPACDRDLVAFLPPGARLPGRSSAGVRCPGSRPWTIYAGATVRAFGRVVVAARAVGRGARLRAADLRLARQELTYLRGEYATDPAPMVGRLTRRRLRAGTVVDPGKLIVPYAVRRGEQVTLVLQRGDLRVTARGVALDDARIGERLAVRNLSSEARVEGRLGSGHRVIISL